MDYKGLEDALCDVCAISHLLDLLILQYDDWPSKNRPERWDVESWTLHYLLRQLEASSTAAREIYYGEARKQFDELKERIDRETASAMADATDPSSG